MNTTAEQRNAIIQFFAMADEGIIDPAPLARLRLPAGCALILTRDQERDEMLLAIPGVLDWIGVSKFMADCAAAEDNGRALLAQLWPTCPPDFAEKILAAISIAPALAGVES